MRWTDMLCAQYVCKVIISSNDLSENILGYNECLAENYRKYHELVWRCRLTENPIDAAITLFV